MNLFIGNLPVTVTEGDLLSLLRLPQEEATRRLRIFKRADRKGSTQRFGLVYVESDADLRKMLERSRNAELDGQRLNVREFYSRAAGNERRALNWRSKKWPHAERRSSERRSAAA